MCFHSETYLGVANPAKHQKHKRKLGDRKNVGTNDVPTFLLIHFIYVHTCLIVYVAEMLEKISFFSILKDDVVVCHICYVCKVCYCGQFVT